MRTLRGARIPPDKLPVQVHGHCAYIRQDILCELDGTWENVFWFREEFCEYAV